MEQEPTLEPTTQTAKARAIAQEQEESVRPKASDLFSKREDRESVKIDNSSSIYREMRANFLLIQQEVNKLDDKVKPLAAIPDLVKKRIPGFNDREIAEIDVDFENATTKQRQTADPEKVLAALDAFINSKPLAEKRMEQIGMKFATKEALNQLRQQVNNDEDRKTAYNELTKMIRQLQEKQKEMDSGQGALEQDITLITQKMLSKAPLSALDTMQKEMDEFINKEQYRALIIRLESYTSLESFNKYRLQLEREMLGFKLKFDQVPIKDDLGKMTENLRNYVQELNSRNSTRGNCAKDKADLMKELDTMRVDLLRTREELSQQGKVIRQLQAQMKNKIERDEMDKVTDLVKLLPTKEEVAELRENVSYNISKFQKDNARFSLDFEIQKQMIRRYDEVITQKSSKHDVRELEKELHDKFEKKNQDLLDLIDKNARDLQKQRDKFRAFCENILTEIHTSVVKASDEHYKKIQCEEDASVPQIQGLSTIRSEGQNGIIKVLSLKADRIDLEKLDELKQSKEEAENFMDLIVQMNSQIQHVVVILNETLKMNLLKAGDTKQAKENRSHELMAQVQALSQWTLKFDAKRRMQQEFSTYPYASWDGSIDSEPKGEDILSSTQAALRESIATGKESSQRRYKSPMRQQKMISLSRHHRGALNDNQASADLGSSFYKTQNRDNQGTGGSVNTGRNLMVGLRQNQRKPQQIPPLKQDSQNSQTIDMKNPNLQFVFPGKAQQDHVVSLFQTPSRASRVGSPPLFSDKNPVLSQQHQIKPMSRPGRSGPMTAATLTRKTKKQQILAADSIEDSQMDIKQGPVNSIAQSNRKMRLRTLSNKQAVTVQMSHKKSTQGRNDPFNLTNPLVESQDTHYNEMECQDQIKGMTGIGFEKDKQYL